jgi:HEPN domain-containing protein
VPLDIELVREWFRYADTDLAVANTLLAHQYPTPMEIICYHCQQAGEKYLKGCLLWYGIEPPRIHDLLRLGRLCNQYDTRFSQLDRQNIYLSQYGVQPRYPAEIPIDASIMNLCIRYASDIRDFKAIAEIRAKPDKTV